MGPWATEGGFDEETEEEKWIGGKEEQVKAGLESLVICEPSPLSFGFPVRKRW